MARAARRREDTHIDQYMRRRFDELGIAWEQTRRSASTDKTRPLRGDLWVSRARHDAANFESRIVALIECKDRQCAIDDTDWQDAHTQGMRKATLQELNSFFVTNTDGLTRCYNAHNGEEVSLDGQAISDFQTPPSSAQSKHKSIVPIHPFTCGLFRE